MLFIKLLLAMTGPLISSFEMKAMNRALKRPTYESSAFKSTKCGPLYASKAVDGNADPVVDNCFCFHSKNVYEMQVWMAIDLEKEYKIDYVVIYGRTFHEDRLDNFITGLTNIFPNKSSVMKYTYPLCGQYPGEFPVLRKATLKCNYNLPEGRYLIVQMDSQWNGIGMAVCEVEAYNLPIRDIYALQWTSQIGLKLPFYNISTMLSHRGIITCIIQCISSSNSRCDSINHNAKTDLCEFNRHVNGFSRNEFLVNQSDWNFWSASFAT